MMLRAGKSGPDPLVLVGLTEENVRRLMNDKPILAELSSFVPGMPGRLAIVYGRTHIELETTLAPLTSAVAERSFDPVLRRQEQAMAANEKILVATVGLPRSGKTTWAKSQAWPVVNPDSIRLGLHGRRYVAEAEPMVWAVAKLMVRSLFLAGHKTVILDATNGTKSRRAEWFDPAWKTYWKVIDTPKEECLRRAKESGDDEIAPVIERMSEKWESLDESCDLW